MRRTKKMTMMMRKMMTRVMTRRRMRRTTMKKMTMKRKRKRMRRMTRNTCTQSLPQQEWFLGWWRDSGKLLQGHCCKPALPEMGNQLNRRSNIKVTINNQHVVERLTLSGCFWTSSRKGKYGLEGWRSRKKEEGSWVWYRIEVQAGEGTRRTQEESNSIPRASGSG